MTNKLTRRIYLMAVVFMCIVIIIEGLVLYSEKSGENININNYAQKVITICSKAGYRPACYDKEIPKLMDSISMEDAFKVTKIIQNIDKGYTYCHVLGHELSAREVDKDPSKWKDVIARVPSGICSNGGIHGAFQERFRADSFTPEQIEQIKPDFMGICEKRVGWNPTGLEQGSCYHALGHLTMYVTSAEIKRALSLCDDLTTKAGLGSWVHLCYDGAFMQIFQPLEPEDFALIKGKEVNRQQHKSFCSQFSGQERGSCISEGWPLYLSDIKKGPEGLVNFCNMEQDSEIDRCYESMMYVITAQFGLNPDKVINYCPGLPTKRIGMCFASAASRMMEVDYGNINQAVELCQSASIYDKNDTCFSQLANYSSYNLGKGSPEFNTLCQELPEKWKNVCLGKNETTP